MYVLHVVIFFSFVCQTFLHVNFRLQVHQIRCRLVDNVDNLITGFHKVWFPSSRGFLPSLFRLGAVCYVPLL
jgi:hypothetical protein